MMRFGALGSAVPREADRSEPSTFASPPPIAPVMKSLLLPSSPACVEGGRGELQAEIREAVPVDVLEALLDARRRDAAAREAIIIDLDGRGIDGANVETVHSREWPLGPPRCWRD